MKASKEMEGYFKDLNTDLSNVYVVAEAARKLGLDPEPKVDIPVARNMAERVEGLISAVAPQIIGKGIPQRIAELEKKFGNLDWRVSLLLAEEIAREKFCKFKDKVEAMEVGIRVGLAYITLGTVASPLEGFTNLKIKKTNNGKEYFALYFSGPIRSAGGTGASVGVLIADYVRRKFGYEKYDPDEKEVNRYAIELYDYHERITNLQYLPSVEEIKFLAQNLPVQIDGDPSEKIEVSNFKDLPRIETNNIRNGVCLVVGEGIAQKAPKLWKQLAKWGNEFDMDQWNFLDEFVKLQKSIKAKGEGGSEKKDDVKVKPDYTFIKDLVAGRPVLTHPMRPGGFRLRYGRSRVSGYSAYCIHPATMYILDNYIGIGTQLKLERPGKATSVTVNDSIDGPMVCLNDGTVIKVDTIQLAKKVQKEVKKILFLGDMLISYGEFVNRAHVLAPPGYCPEWWVQELEKGIVDMFGNLDYEKAAIEADLPPKALEKIIQNPLTTKLSAQSAFSLSQTFKIPMHPEYTFFWDIITIKEVNTLVEAITVSKSILEQNSLQKIVLPFGEQIKLVLERLGIPHRQAQNEFLVVMDEYAKALLWSLGIDDFQKLDMFDQKTILANQQQSGIKLINELSLMKLRDKAGIFVGARMGRPEKSKVRQLTGSPHVLFPVGEEGGRLRSFQSALEAGKINGEFPMRFCKKCNKESIYESCYECGKPTEKKHSCRFCGDLEKDSCEHHEKAPSYKNSDVPIRELFNRDIKKLKMSHYPDLIKGVRGTSNKEHIPEPLIKGILRAKHDIFVNKDGTTRYDMTQVPITHFKPKEIKTTVPKLISLGYHKDIKGKDLTHDDQVLELKPQDVILPSFPDTKEGADHVLFKVTKFIDEMLVKHYGLKPFYNVERPQDLAGHLVVALAPHTSAAILCRIIGFSTTQGFFAHPLIHAATRRDCDGDEASVTLLLDMLLNFSRKYLSAHRGSTQDACLVITSNVNPTEVDDMIFDLDIAWKYPLEFYEACLAYKYPWDIKIKTVGDVLGTDEQFEGMGYTHPLNNMNEGVFRSAYKTLPSMQEKLYGQMELARKIVAVDERDVARMVIEKHFLKDTKGNLRKFSMQVFRCVKCNDKFRRPPLIGKCTSCGGKLIFTIAEGSVVKYLEPSLSIAKNYDVHPYLKQTLDLLKKRVESVFGKEKERQEGLGKWF